MLETRELRELFQAGASTSGAAEAAAAEQRTDGVARCLGWSPKRDDHCYHEKSSYYDCYV